MDVIQRHILDISVKRSHRPDEGNFHSGGILTKGAADRRTIGPVGPAPYTRSSPDPPCCRLLCMSRSEGWDRRGAFQLRFGVAYFNADEPTSACLSWLLLRSFIIGAEIKQHSFKLLILIVTFETGPLISLYSQGLQSVVDKNLFESPNLLLTSRVPPWTSSAGIGNSQFPIRFSQFPIRFLQFPIRNSHFPIPASKTLHYFSFPNTP